MPRLLDVPMFAIRLDAGRFRWGAGAVALSGFLLTMGLAGCQSERSGPWTADRAEESAEEKTPTSQGDSVLQPVPLPDLSRLEEDLQQQIRDARSKVQAAKAGGSPLDHARAYGELAMLYHACDLREAAQACYLNAEALNPRDFRWSYYLGRLYRLQGQPEKAVEHFERALGRMPPGQEVAATVAVLYWTARAYFDQSNLDAAQRLFSKVIGIQENSAPAMVGLGRVAAARGDSRQAVEHFKKALALAPRVVNLRYRLAMEYRKLGLIDKAQRHLGFVQGAGGFKMDLVPPDPLMEELRGVTNSARISQHQGNVALLEGQLEAAAEQHRKAVARDPQDPVAHSKLAATLEKLGDPEGAIEQYKEALRLDPADVTAHFGMGVIYAQQGQDKEAVEHYLAVLRVDPDDREAHFNLANSLARLGRHQEALPHYSRVVKLDPGNWRARMNEAMTLIQAQRYHHALLQLEEAQDAFPENMEIKNILARLLAACPDETIRDGSRSLHLAQLVVRSNGNVEHLETLAMAYAELGQFDKAIEWQQSAIRAAERANRPELLSPLQNNLRYYEEGTDH